MGVGADGALRNLYWGAPLWRTRRSGRAPRPPRPLLLRPAPDARDRRVPRLGRPALLRARAQDHPRQRQIATSSCATRPTASAGNELDIDLKDIKRPDRSHAPLSRLSPTTASSAAARPSATRTRRAFRRRERAVRHLVSARRRRLPAHLPDRPLGRRDAARIASRSTTARRSRKPQGPHQPPCQPVVRHRRGRAAEEHGRVWFGALGWSGNWRITVEQTPYRQVRVTGGLNTFDFAYPLKPGEIAGHAALLRRLLGRRASATRRACCTASSASRSCPAARKSRLRPVLYNSWEATTFASTSRGRRTSPTRPPSSASSCS